MRCFIIEQSSAEVTSHSGLAQVGTAFNRHWGLPRAVDRQIPLRHGIGHSDIELLCLGKSDFEAAANVRDERFFFKNHADRF
jgi:hypothetical protein